MEEKFAYGSVLEALSRGLYPDKRHIIREFVQNAFDGLFELRKHHPYEPTRAIEIRIQVPSIIIADHGIGMPRKRMQEYRYLGYSEKERTEHAGFRGIGKYSGLAIAERIIVDSSPYGHPLRFQVVIHVGDMMREIGRRRNAPLEELLRDYTTLSETAEDKDKHYTFVELHGIGKDSFHLLDPQTLRDYLSRIAPVPMNPAFRFAQEIDEQLRENIPDFFQSSLRINGECVYKCYLSDCRRPEYQTILVQDRETDALAFAWYCQNTKKGQFRPQEDSGLVYRMRNIAIGDRHLTRKTLWHATPERAFHFFGEIHVLHPGVIPSADRTDFEDNPTRKRLYERCRQVSSILNRKAGEESATRRFREVLSKAEGVVSEKKRQLSQGQMPLELRDEIIFEIQKFREDIEKRIPGSSGPLQRRGRRFLKRSQKLLSQLKDIKRDFFDLQKELRLNREMKCFYEAVVAVLKEEFGSDRERLERIIRRIHDAVRGKQPN